MTSTTATPARPVPAFFAGLIDQTEYDQLGVAGRIYVSTKVGTGMRSEHVLRNAHAADGRAL